MRIQGSEGLVLTNESAVVSAQGVIDGDLPCADCGYNLRTLPQEGRCPECGRAVLDSVLPTSPRFASWTEIRRVRVGVGLLALSILIPTLTDIAYVLMNLNGTMFAQVLDNPTGVAASVFDLGAKAYSYSLFVAYPLQAVAVVLMVAPLGIPRGRGRHWWRWGTALIMIMGVVGHLYTAASFYSQLPTSTGIVLNPHITIAGSVMYGAGGLLAWLYLTSRLSRQHWPAAMLMWTVAVEWAVSFLLGVLWGIVTEYLGSDLVGMGGGVVRFNTAPAWHGMVQQCFAWWQHYMQLPATVLMLVALWAYIRTLNTALQRGRAEG